jgi:hypothetical protein
MMSFASLNWVYPNYSTLESQKESSRDYYLSEGAWLGYNLNLLMEIQVRLWFNLCSLRNSILLISFQPCRDVETILV